MTIDTTNRWSSESRVKYGNQRSRHTPKARSLNMLFPNLTPSAKGVLFLRQRSSTYIPVSYS